MGPLPASLSSSPRKLLDRNSSKLNAVVQRDIKSSLLLLLVLSTVLVLSVLYSSQADQTGAQSGGIQVEEKCDMSMGKWVRDPRGPLYTNLTCPTLPDSKNCQKYGKDPGHLFWRWQPDGCDLPRFSPERFLDVVRGKRLAFIGDSLARNQMESLLCLLSQAETPTLVDRDALDKFVTWHFPVHNFTLMVMWTEFYAHTVPVPDTNGKPPIPFDIHLDRIANLTDFGIVYAIRRVVKAALQAIAVCKDCKSNLVTFLRTYTPGHHEHSSWSSGGYCNRTRPLKEEEISLVSIEWELRNTQDEEVRAARETTGSKRFGVLYVTKAMMLRADGHIGAHKDKRWVNASDCLHWCLPGPIDMWNDMLLQRLTEDSPPVV
ncbi:hypothetical protein EJB05_22821, partial [Eragrostis curvula]